MMESFGKSNLTIFLVVASTMLLLLNGYTILGVALMLVTAAALNS